MHDKSAGLFFLHRDFSVSKHVSVQEQTDSFSPLCFFSSSQNCSFNVRFLNHDNPLWLFFFFVFFLFRSANNKKKKINKWIQLKQSTHNILVLEHLRVPPWLTHTHASIHPLHTGWERKPMWGEGKTNLTVIVFIHIGRSSGRAAPHKTWATETSRIYVFFFPGRFSAWLCLIFSPPRWQTVKAGVWQKDGRRCQRWNEWRGGKKEREKTSGCRLNRGPLKNEGGGISEVSDRDVRDWPLRFSLLLHPQLLRLHSH